MKFYFGIIFVLCLIYLVNAKSCESFLDCSVDECCKDFLISKQCMSLRKEGETCNGRFLCDCKLEYRCKKQEDSRLNFMKLGEGRCVSEIR